MWVRWFLFSAADAANDGSQGRKPLEIMPQPLKPRRGESAYALANNRRRIRG